jgi:ribose/xylose/arabinose/galactoside ABC-type transport system permease subunit
VRRPVALARIAGLVLLAAAAFSTPGFLSKLSLLSLLTTVSFIGCVAIGMTLITLSGNIMSLCLGVTAAATTIVFVTVLNRAGLTIAVLAALSFGALLTAAQGWAIGRLRANSIIVSIAAFALIHGGAHWATGGASSYAAPGAGHELFRMRVLGIPVEFLVFLLVLTIGQFIVSYTTFGRNVLMVGSSLRAAQAAGVRTWRTITGAYFWAGLFTAVSGILLAARYNAANMEYAVGYDYDAIAAVLVGGTAIAGGQGSVVRTLAGVLVIGVVQMVLLLRGFRQEWQITIVGLVVLAMIMLQTAER